MALLGDLTAVERNLRAMPASSLNADATARLAAIQPAVTAYIEGYTGRVFGEPAVPESIEITQYDPIYGHLLYLPKGLRSLTSVVEGPTWSAGAWSGGTTLTTSQYRPAAQTVDGVYRALVRVDGYWVGTYLVTGIWEDTGDGGQPPDEITYAANLLIADLFKYEQSSTASQAGPEGQTLRLRDSTKNPIVREILDRYALTTLLVL